MGLIRSLFTDPLAKATDELVANVLRPRGKNFDPSIAALADDGSGVGPPSSQSWTKRHLGTPLLSYDALSWYARQPVLGLPPKIRRLQVLDFCQPVESPLKQGFRIRLIDEGREMTKADKVEARRLAQIVYRAGGRYQWPPSPGDHGGMGAAINMFMRDSLVYDQAVFEVLRERGGGVYGWLVHDATMFRLARADAEAYRTRQFFPEDEDICFVEVDEFGHPVQTFDRNELCWFVRTPRSQLRWRGYGFPEYDEGNAICETLLGAYTFNAVNFKNGVHAYNIMVAKGGIDPTQFEKLRLNILTMLTQARNAHRTMVLNLEKDADFDVKQIGSSNADMEFSNWLNFQAKLMCALYGLDPAEINLLYGAEGVRSALSTAGPEERIKASKDRSLRPLLRQLAEALTLSVVRQENPDFCLEFCGLGLPSEMERLDMDIKAVSSFKSVDEVRAEHDLPAFDIPESRLPLSLASMLKTSRQGDGAGEFDGSASYMPPVEDGEYDLAPDYDVALDETAMDRAMKGTNWNDVDEWTTRWTRALVEQQRAKHVNGTRYRVDLSPR